MWRLLYQERHEHADVQWARPVPLFLVVLPFIVMLVWIVLTLCTYTHWAQRAAAIVVSFVSILASWWYAQTRDKPFKPPCLEEMRKALETIDKDEVDPTKLL